MHPSAVQPARATYDDLLKAPEDVVAELVDGYLFMSPRPRAAHTRFTHEFGFRLSAAFEKGLGGPGGWGFREEPEIHIFSDVVVPDLAGWKQARMPAERMDTLFYTTVPDFVLEVLSPSTAVLDRTRKLPLYARAGVGHVWLADPIERTIEAYFTKDGMWTLAADMVAGGPKAVRLPPFDAAELDLSTAWISEPPAP